MDTVYHYSTNVLFHLFYHAFTLQNCTRWSVKGMRQILTYIYLQFFYQKMQVLLYTHFLQAVTQVNC